MSAIATSTYRGVPAKQKRIEFIDRHGVPLLRGSLGRVLQYIAASTIGFKKESDGISLNQLWRGKERRNGAGSHDHGTGLSRSSAWEALHGRPDRIRKRDGKTIRGKLGLAQLDIGIRVFSQRSAARGHEVNTIAFDWDRFFTWAVEEWQKRGRPIDSSQLNDPDLCPAVREKVQPKHEFQNRGYSETRNHNTQVIQPEGGGGFADHRRLNQSLPSERIAAGRLREVPHAVSLPHGPASVEIKCSVGEFDRLQTILHDYVTTDHNWNPLASCPDWVEGLPDRTITAQIAASGDWCVPEIIRRIRVLKEAGKKPERSYAWFASMIGIRTARRGSIDVGPFGRSEPEPFAPLPGDAVLLYLAEKATAISAAGVDFGPVADSLDQIIAELPSLSADIEAVDKRLAPLEKQLVAIARARQTEEQALTVRRELDAYLQPYRSRMMTAPQIAALGEQRLHCYVLEMAGLPRLSLSDMHDRPLRRTADGINSMTGSR
jgi:hypothetical protein